MDAHMRKRNLIGLLLIVTFIIVAVASAHAAPGPVVIDDGLETIDAAGVHALVGADGRLMALHVQDEGAVFGGTYVMIAQADPVAQVGAATVESPPVPPAVSADTPAPPTLPDEVDEVDEAASLIYKGVTTGDWFLVAGVGVTILCWLLLGALEKKWWQFGNDRVRWVTVGVVAGLLGVVNAWISPDHSPDVETLVGAAKVFAAAVFAFYTAKKLVAPTNASHATPA